MNTIPATIATMSAVPATIATMNTMMVTMASINIPVGSSPIGPVGPEFASVARSHGVDQAMVREYVFLVEGYIKSCYDKPVRMLELGMGCRRVSISSPSTQLDIRRIILQGLGYRNKVA